MRKIIFGLAALSLIASASAASAIGGQPHVDEGSNYFFPGIDRQPQTHSGYAPNSGYTAQAPYFGDGGHGVRDNDNR